MKLKILIWILLFSFLISSVTAAIRTIQDESDEIIYTADEISYTITVVYIGKGEVKFNVNDEVTKLLGYHDTYEFEDGSVIYVREILEEEAKEGPDKVVFNFYPAMCADSDCAFELKEPGSAEETVEEEEEEKGEETAEEDIEEDVEEEEVQEVEEDVEEDEEEADEDEEPAGDEEIDEEAFEEEGKKQGLLKRLYLWFVEWFIWWDK